MSSRLAFVRRLRPARATVALAVAALVAVPVLAACGGSGSSSSSSAASGKPGLSKVTLRVADQVGQTRARLDAAGVLKDTPYKISWSNFAAAAPQLQAIAAGAADIGGAGDAPTLNAIGSGAPIKIVAATRYAPAGLALFVPKDSPIRTVADLRGKTVSPTTKGSVGHYLLLGALKKAGLTSKDVKISFLSPQAAGAAFDSGKLDAWATWDPYTALEQAKNVRVLTTGVGISTGLGFIDASEKALADPGKKAAIADFLNRLNRANAWAKANPAAYAKLYAQLTKLPDNVAAIVSKRNLADNVPLDDHVIDSLQQVADVYAAEGVINKKIDVRPSFVRVSSP